MQTVPHLLWKPLLLCSCLCGFSLTGVAEVAPKALAVVNTGPQTPADPNAKTSLNASLLTQTQARTLRLSIPAPRGQIVDRNGVPFAQNRVANYLALNFPFMEGATPEKILSFAKGKIAAANKILGKNWSVPDDRLLSHYEHRRWLPLVFSTVEKVNEEITEEQQVKLKPLLEQGLLLQPAYLRYYPHDDSACHIVGYVRKTRPLPLGPIADNDPLFEEMEGREGLEVSFDSALQGRSGEINLLFDPNGKLLSDEVLRRPSPGRTVVTTLDFKLQKYVENALKKYTRNGGAMVIMDIRNGDILAMASNPGFNPNDFIPGINDARWNQLSNDPKDPLFQRAFRQTYPPASTFKVITALGGLESGAIQPNTSFDCNTGLQVGDRVFHNWNTKSDEGSMNVITAIKRSCNTWFYQAALATGADPISQMAFRMGFGERTGIPLRGENKGYVPTSSDHKILAGELANMSIGQGTVLVTPLQVCQCMAALGDGVNMPQPRLVKQIQTINEIVVEAFEPKVRKQVNLRPDARDAVVKGMVAVVSGDGGTGHNAAIKQVQIAGKTGTAQWKVNKDQNLAWFTGFLPASQPILAFAVVYEGSPGERISGGAIAAPIVSEVFTKFYQGAPTDDPLVAAMKDVPKALAVDEGSLDGSSSGVPELEIERARPAQQPQRPPERSLGGFFRRLFGR